MVYNNGIETILATLVFLKENNHYLMLNRDKDKKDFMYGNTMAPGGKFILGETKEECAKREFHEETGLTIMDLKYLGKVFFDNKERNFNGQPAKYNYLVHIFGTDSYRGQLDFFKDPKGSPIWVQCDKITDLKCEKGDNFIFKSIKNESILNHIIKLNDSSYEILPIINEDDFPEDQKYYKFFQKI